MSCFIIILYMIHSGEYLEHLVGSGFCLRRGGAWISESGFASAVSHIHCTIYINPRLLVIERERDLSSFSNILLRPDLPVPFGVIYRQ